MQSVSLDCRLRRALAGQLHILVRWNMHAAFLPLYGHLSLGGCAIVNAGHLAHVIRPLRLYELCIDEFRESGIKRC